MSALGISIDLFRVDSYVKGIFESHMIVGDLKVLITLEQYKFIQREDLINTLYDSGMFSLKENSSLKEINFVKRISEFLPLEQKYGVIVSRQNDVCEIVIPLLHDFHGLQLETLELKLHTDKIVVSYVTPMNFVELAPELYSPLDYDPTILFKRLLLEVIYKNGTDIHISVLHNKTKPVYVTQYRRDGLMCDLSLFPMTAELNTRLIFAITSKYTNANPNDLLSASGIVSSINDVFGDGSIELRLSISRVLDGYELVGRIQNRKTVSLRISELGFPIYLQADLMRLTKKRSGITLITGPIRTGKNTTAFALANEMVTQPIKIKSFESPIEAIMPFPQSDYLGDPKRLAEFCRLAKKQDVNVAFINEIPDKKVAFAVKDLVNSSIYVITTMHIDRIWHLPFKLYEYYDSSYKDVISQINGVVNQKMCGIKCPHCQSVMLTQSIKEQYVKDLLLENGVKSFAVSNGCEKCVDVENGKYGLIKGCNQPFAEYLIFTDDLKRELLACREPYEMSDVLKNRVQESGHTLEKEMCKAVSEFKIDVEDLNLIL